MHMPRVTVYVSDDLKVRMDEAEETINWSTAAQAAFREAIAIHRLKKDNTDMDSVIERLRASKRRTDESSATAGRGCGAKWAKETAEYDELRRVTSHLEESGADWDYSISDMRRLIDPSDWLTDQEWKNYWSTHGRDATDSNFIRGFVEGAAEVLLEVKDKL